MAEVPKPPSILNALEFGIHAAGSREISWLFVAELGTVPKLQPPCPNCAWQPHGQHSCHNGSDAELKDAQGRLDIYDEQIVDVVYYIDLYVCVPYVNTLNCIESFCLQ